MSSSIETDRIIELARSEVKRWGGTQPSLTHVAYVLARTWPDAFSEHFGHEGRREVEGLLRGKVFLGDERAARELLTSSSDLSSAVKALRDRLGAAASTRTAALTAVEGASSAPTDEALSVRTASWLRRVKPADRDGIVRTIESAEVAVHLLRPDAPLVAVIGDPGVGRTALLAEVAAQLASSRRPMPIWRMGAETRVSNVAASLGQALDDLREPSAIVIDDFDQLADLGTDQPDRRLLDAVGAARSHPHARLLIVMSRARASRVGVLHQDLDDALVKVMLTPLPASQLRPIAAAVATAHAEAAGLGLGEDVVDAVLSAPAEGALQVHPGLAIGRIDHGIGRALLVGADEVAVEHLSAGSGVRPVGVESLSIQDVLRTKVRGQDAAIEKVAQRLAITRTGLDLRPQRPNGVFLFTGPTGVGKTELATQIAVAEYGSPDRLIRLDMSEYSHDWAVSRIAGPMPGYVGSTEPESWLTTRVAAMPYCVVLLDEIEKAHPRVWNVFLQVFDAGRLTDSRGTTADFAHTTIVMTSNLGAREASSAGVGFGSASGNGVRQLEVIKDTMAPELLNRMDEVIVFNPLSLTVIEEIAEAELRSAVTRLNAKGWLIDYDPDVPTWLARTGYDPAYGGRHLQRNIEREFLGLLAHAPTRNLKVAVEGEALVCEE